MSSAIRELTDKELDFLEPHMPLHDPEEELPFTTLTYAQSLDGRIAIEHGRRTLLSGLDSKAMTHYLRCRHDAILIGGMTALTDDPSLNCRYPGATITNQPQPVIIDGSGNWLRRALYSEVYQLATKHQGKIPWRISTHQAIGMAFEQAVDTDELGITTLTIPQDVNQGMKWSDILKALKRQGINSVMIEGGAKVIQSLLLTPEVINSVIITIAPTFLGENGVSIAPRSRVTADNEPCNAAWVNKSRSRQFGKDIVLCGQLDIQSSEAPPAPPAETFDVTMR